MVWTTPLLFTAATAGFSFLVWVSVAILDELEALRFATEGKWKRAD